MLLSQTMRVKKCVFCYALLLSGLTLAANASAQESTTYERGADGVTYRVSRRVVQRSVPTTEYETRQEKVYQPRQTTEYRTYQQNYVTPVTQYQWVSRLKGRWNPFVQPHWKHELAPVTRWESRPATVQMPTVRTDWVEQQRTVQIPVTKYKTVNEEYTSRVAMSTPVPASSLSHGTLSPVTSQPMLAAAPTSITPYPAGPESAGGQRLDNDPPRVGSEWRSSTTSGGAYRR